eukprot:SAG11_NODE_8342_length_1026_cov_1.779935_1_plen_79_part_10
MSGLRRFVAPEAFTDSKYKLLAFASAGSRRLLFHLMSAGAYMFGQMLGAMQVEPWPDPSRHNGRRILPWPDSFRSAICT